MMTHDTENEFDILSVGDVMTDDFIRLEDTQAHEYHNEYGRWLAMKFGSKLPFDHREVVAGTGNAANAAVALTRMGLRTSFVTNVGGDSYGQNIIQTLGKNNVDTRYVRINPKALSNYNFILWYKEERTILIKHEEYDYHWPHLRPKEAPKWVYFSSLSEHALAYHDQVADWLDEHPAVQLAFQPGTFQLSAGAERLKRIYQRTNVVIMNREEAVTVGGGDYHNIPELIDRLHALGPQIVVVTDGHAGAYASTGQQRLKMPIYPDSTPPYERTGAGDAFAATFVGALARGWGLEGALQLAPINSMSVCQHVGSQAGLLNEQQLEAYLKQAPEWYHPSPF